MAPPNAGYRQGARHRGLRRGRGFVPVLAIGLLALVFPGGVQGQTLELVKTGSVLAVPGATLTYVISIELSSILPATATLEVVDPFPAELFACSWQCSSSGDAECGSSSGTGDIVDLPTLTSNLFSSASVAYVVTCSIDSDAIGSVTNTVQVSGTIDDASIVGQSSFSTVLIQSADLAIAKSAPATATPGGSIVYTVEVTNPTGPSAADGVSVTDTPPNEVSGVTWTCAASGGASCPASGTGGLAATVRVPVGGGVTFTVTGDIDPAATGTLTNTASVGGPAGGTDPNTSNNTATATSTLVPSADLSITKTDGQTTAAPGEAITYTIVVANAGPSDSTNATVIDSFPATLLSPTWTCVESGGAECTSAGVGNLADTVDLPSGATATYTVRGTLSAAATGTLTNSAVVAEGDVNDPDPSNNLATDTDTIVPSADLSITKTDLADPALAGGSLLYRLTVANAGPSNASGAEVTDLLPTGITFVSASGAASCFAALDVATGRDLVTCFFDALTAGTQAAVTVTTAVATTLSGEIVNEATVATVASDTDPDSSDDTASQTTEVVIQGDLAVAQSADQEPVAVAGTLTYTVTVTNAGSGTVDGVTLTDPLPTGLSFLSAAASQGSCTGGATVECDLGSLAPGAAATVTLSVRVLSSAPASITNTATVSAPAITDTDPSNDSASVTTTVERSADLTLTKEASPRPVSAGSLLRYTFTVTNAGPGDAPSTVITDSLPAGTRFVAPVATGELIFADDFEAGDFSAWSGVEPKAALAKSHGACSAAGSTVTCSLGTLASGASDTVAFDVEVLPGTTGSLTNSATVSSAVTDPTPADNTASVTVAVVRRIDVGVEIADSPDPVFPGGTLTYTLTVTNAGPSSATGVAMGDPLPPELTLLSAVASQGSCVQTQEVLCTLGTLGSGAAATVTIRARVSAAASGAITNAAAVVANETDLNQANDTDTETTTVSP